MPGAQGATTEMPVAARTAGRAAGRNGRMARWDRLDLPAIDAAVRDAMAHLPSGSEGDAEAQSRRLMEGYHHVDQLLADRVEIFAYGQAHHLLELNHRVLLGTTPERRTQFANHIAETEHWFYDRADTGMSELDGWYARHRSRDPLTLAGAAIVQVVSRPQLFIEGNKRTAVLIASYLLARDGYPPVVITSEHHAAFTGLTDRAARIERRGLVGSLQAMLATRRLVDFLRETGERRMLREPLPLTR